MKRTKQEGPHDRTVARILSDAVPVRRVPSAGRQWGLWLLSSGLSVGLFLAVLHLQGMREVFRNMPSLGFLTLAYLGSALAAWEAISSSLPGRQTGKVHRWLAGGILLSLYAMPFFFFSSAPGDFDIVTCCGAGWSCIQWGALAGLLPWVVLGILLSRNAAMRPLWTGLWAGLSAFLLGAFTIQLHCPSWETGHMFVAHLLPVIGMTLPAAVIGSYWFSKWRR